MVLQRIAENSGWIMMEWQCSFIMRWEPITKIATSLSRSLQNCEVIAGNQNSNGTAIDPSTRPEEKDMLVVRGYADHFQGNLSMTFYTQQSTVIVAAPMSLGLPIDYESLSKAFGLYMDTIELNMYASQ